MPVVPEVSQHRALLEIPRRRFGIFQKAAGFEIDRSELRRVVRRGKTVHEADPVHEMEPFGGIEGLQVVIAEKVMESVIGREDIHGGASVKRAVFPVGRMRDIPPSPAVLYHTVPERVNTRGVPLAGTDCCALPLERRTGRHIRSSAFLIRILMPSPGQVSSGTEKAPVRRMRGVS